MPEVSIVVPCRDVEQYLETCVASLRAQSQQDIEIILVDDRSTDGTAEIVARHAGEDPRIRMCHGPGRGPGPARNQGQSNACGKYVLFLDADDWLEPAALSSMTREAESSGADITACDTRYIWEDGRSDSLVIDGWPAGLGAQSPQKAMLVAPCATGNKLIRRQWLNETGVSFPPGRYEDFIWQALLAPRLRKVAYVAQPYYVYLQRGTSFLHLFSAETRDMLSVTRDILANYRGAGLYHEYVEELAFMFLRAVGVHWNHRWAGRPGGRPPILESVRLLRDSFPGWQENAYLKTWDGRSRLLLSAYMRAPTLTWLMYFLVRWARAASGRPRRRRVRLAGYGSGPARGGEPS